MSERRSPSSAGRDALGILLMAVAVLAGVSVVMTMLHPVSEAAGFTALFTKLVDGIGPIAGLFLSLGIFVVGVRMWMAGFSDRVGRDLFGVLITSLTLSILVGTLAPDLAGRFGALCGASVTRRLTVLVGVPYGLACVLLPVWFFWLRGRLGSGSPSLARALGQTLAPTARSAADVEDDSEALAVTPLSRASSTESGKPDFKQFKPETRPPSPPTPSGSPAASPYAAPAPDARLADVRPPDVRLWGGVPAGAQPLAPTHVEPVQTSTSRPATVSRGPHVDRGHAIEPVGEDLAAARGSVAAAREHERDELRRELAQPDDGEPDNFARAKTRGPADDRLVEDDELADDELTTAALEQARSEFADDELAEAELVETELVEKGELAEREAPVAAPIVGAEVTPISQRPPQPSWEQPGLFDEPVDAYGTPLSLVDALRQANEETVERLGEPEVATEAPGLALPATEIGEPAPGLFDQAPAAADDEELEDEAEDAAPAPESDEDTDDDEEEQEEDEEQDDELADEDEEVAVIIGGELDDDEIDEERAEEPQVAIEPVAARQLEIAEVVLQPQPRPKLTVEAEPELVGDDAPAADDLVYRAGCLFVDRGRVAVSMLQREFGLDFKAATEVLDQLQKAGLIGPYLGGQRRDILLTREEWAQRIGAA